MSIGTGVGIPMLGTSMTAARFRDIMVSVLPDRRLVYLPASGDTNTSTSLDPLSKTITHSASLAGRKTAQGYLTMASYASASSQYSSTPNADSLRFGNGMQDLPFSVVAFVNVTNTAAQRQIVSKYTGAGAAEYAMAINASDQLLLLLTDDSAAVNTQRTTTSAITQGQPQVFIATYSGLGGATAGNGITLYGNGAVLASSASNNAAYVAMEGSTAPVEIGSVVNHSLQFLDGSVGLVAICGVELTTNQIAAIMAGIRFGSGLALT